jgi:hypothetical protein
MKIRRCPDCSTGWRYAEDLPSVRYQQPAHHGLVPCPTCSGTGRVLEPDDSPVKFSDEAFKRRHVKTDRYQEAQGEILEMTLVKA